MVSRGTDPFEESEDQQALRKLARDVAERELAPRARHWDETEEVLAERARVDVSSAILAQLTFNGPPRAIEHLGNETLKQRWLPLAASGDGLFCIGISEP